MKFYSTNNPEKKVDLATAVISGIADDGGLYMPERIPKLPRAFIDNLQGMTLPEMSYAVANYALMGSNISAQEMHDIVFQTLNFPIPLTYIDGDRYVLELFHGPTMGFKDVGARFMARMIEKYTSEHHHEANVLIATSGNAGGAVAQGFSGIEGTHVWVLYPQDGLTRLQEAQFATLGGNVTALKVNGTLQDCRDMVTEAFADRELCQRMHLTSAKTINVARLLPQMFYYFWAYAQLAQREENLDDVVFAVPCGNLGNLTAGIMARIMGLPVKRFVAANNRNNPFVRYLDNGDFTPLPVEPSLAPAMDIAVPRNFKRISALLPSHIEVCELVQGRTCTDAEIAYTIRRAWLDRGYLLDPHSATAYLALADGLQPGEVGVSLATAHPAKYREVVEQAIGEPIEVPQQLVRHLSSPLHINHIGNGYNSLRQFLDTHQ